MTSLGSIAERAIKHICLVGNRDATVQASDGIFILMGTATQASIRSLRKFGCEPRPEG
jgi:hypothetical protein